MAAVRKSAAGAYDIVMTRWPVPAVALVALLAPAAMAEPPATLPAKPYVGTFVYRYGAFVVKAEVPDAKRLKWTVLAQGGEAVASAEQTVERIEIRPDIFLATWVETSGAAVTQVSDFTTMKATSTIVKDGRSTIFSGTIERVKP